MLAVGKNVDIREELEWASGRRESGCQGGWRATIREEGDWASGRKKSGHQEEEEQVLGGNKPGH